MVALRLPNALGLTEGTEKRIREERVQFIFEQAAETPKKIDVSKFAGKVLWLKPISPEKRLFEKRPLDWDGASPGKD